MNLQKQTRWTNEKYIKWLCQQNCVICGEPGHDNNQIVPHHIKGIGHFSGTALKAGDNWAMPMHVKCHDHFHNEALKNGTMVIYYPLGQYDRIVTIDEQLEWVARTLAKAVEEGVLKVGI